MPSHINCNQTDCAFNKDELCDANTIRVRADGRGRNATFCDTASQDGEHAAQGDPVRPMQAVLNTEVGESLEASRKGPRVSCTVSSCSYNNSYICSYKGGLDVKQAGQRFSPVCADFTESL